MSLKNLGMNAGTRKVLFTKYIEARASRTQKTHQTVKSAWPNRFRQFPPPHIGDFRNSIYHDVTSRQ